MLFHYLTVSVISPLGHPAAPFTAAAFTSDPVKTFESVETATVDAKFTPPQVTNPEAAATLALNNYELLSA